MWLGEAARLPDAVSVPTNRQTPNVVSRGRGNRSRCGARCRRVAAAYRVVSESRSVGDRRRFLLPSPDGLFSLFENSHCLVDLPKQCYGFRHLSFGLLPMKAASAGLSSWRGSLSPERLLLCCSPFCLSFQYNYRMSAGRGKELGWVPR